MKPTKMRNYQIYYATMQTASAQMSCVLSKDLRKKYGKRSIRVVEGDSVKVIRGEFNGVDGKVTKVSTANNGLTIEGVKKEKLKGDKYDIYIHTSNIEVTGLNTDDKWRINKLEGKNVRAARPKSEKKETLSGKKLKSEKESSKTENNSSKKTIKKSSTEKKIKEEK
jgi:large subunit ribosomal protein L24